MKTVILDGNVVHSREELHEYLAKEFDFPDYYGKNLDALHDCLTDYQEEAEIEFYEESLTQSIVAYAEALLRVLIDSAIETGRLRVALMDLRDKPEEEEWEPWE